MIFGYRLQNAGSYGYYEQIIRGLSITYPQFIHKLGITYVNTEKPPFFALYFFTFLYVKLWKSKQQDIVCMSFFLIYIVVILFHRRMLVEM